jgi:putative addiction module component (TIGR02574 family)
MTDFQSIFDAALSLSNEDRLRLSDAIRESVPENAWPLPSDDWMAEVRRRSAAIDAGRMPFDDWNTVRERTRRSAGLGD